MALGKVIQRIEIEMSGGTKQYMVSAKQGDRATRYVETVLLNHGEPYTIPAGSSVTAFIRKPDRHRVYTPCEFTDQCCDGGIGQSGTGGSGNGIV